MKLITISIIWTIMSSIAMLTNKDSLSSSNDFLMFEDRFTASSIFPLIVNSNTEDPSCFLLRKNPEYSPLLLLVITLENMKINSTVANSDTTSEIQNLSAPHKLVRRYANTTGKISPWRSVIIFANLSYWTDSA